jgi:hypothetical protein
MTYSADGLGKVYSIPTKSSSSFIPDMTLKMDVPIEQIAQDAWNYLDPIVEQRVHYIMPDVVADAWPHAQQRILASLPQVVPPLLSEIRKNEDKLLTPSQKALLLFGSVAALGAVGYGAYWLWRKFK